MIYSDLIDEKLQESADFGILGKVVEQGKYSYKKFEINIDNENLSKKLKKEQGKYVTINIGMEMHFSNLARDYLVNKLVLVLEQFLKIKKNPYVLVVGLGNAFLVSDSLGAEIIKNLFATHNLPKDAQKGLGDLSALIPGVSGINGIATFDIVKSIIDNLSPDLVIIIDALTAKNYERIGCSFQFSNTSISPGAGVGNKNKKLDKQGLGVDVITIGVPLMINAKNFSQLENLPDLIVTPKEIDIYVNNCSKVLAKAINLAVHGKNYKKFM